MSRRVAPRGLLGIGRLVLLIVFFADKANSEQPKHHLQRQRRQLEAMRRRSPGPEVPENKQNAADWYPHFPRCGGQHPRLAFPGGTQREKCVRLPLHPLAKKATNTGPGPQPVTAVDYTKFPSYVFMLGTPYGGTTPLLGMLSSSPNVTFPRNVGWAHEAHWQLTNKRVFPFMQRSGMGYLKARAIWSGLREDPTVSMQEMEEAWGPIWDKTKSIRVEKSHHLIELAPQIYTHFRAKGSAVKFIILLRHPCTYSGARAQHLWLRETQRFKRVLEEYPDDTILVQFEDFVEHPQRVADRLLRFFPQFGSMDPSKSNLSKQHTTIRGSTNPRAGDRGQAIGGPDNSDLKEKYIYSRMRKPGGMPPFRRGWCEGFPPSRKEISNKEGLDILRFFGYLAPAS